MRKILLILLVMMFANLHSEASTFKISDAHQNSIVNQKKQSKSQYEIVVSTITDKKTNGQFICTVTITVYGNLGEILYSVTRTSYFSGELGCNLAMQYAMDAIMQWLLSE